MITIDNAIVGVQRKVIEVIASNLDEIFAGELSLNMNFSNISLDSITFIKIVVNLESEFNFEFDDEMLLLTKFTTIRSMVEYVESKISTKDENA